MVSGRGLGPGPGRQQPARRGRCRLDELRTSVRRGYLAGYSPKVMLGPRGFGQPGSARRADACPRRVAGTAWGRRVPGWRRGVAAGFMADSSPVGRLDPSLTAFSLALV